MALSIPWVIPPSGLDAAGEPATLRWSVGGIVMDNATLDAHGCRWVAQVDGWNDGSDIRPARGPRPARDGDWQGATFFSGRTVTATGNCFAPDRAGLRAARDRFMAAVAPRQDIRVVSNEIPARSVLGRLDGKPNWYSLNENQAKFSIPIHSTSPFKQGQLVTSQPLGIFGDPVGLIFPIVFPPFLGGSSAVELVPDGNSETWPVLILTGPMPLPVVTLVETGQIVAYNLTIAAGQQLIVDTDTGVASLSGTSVRGAQSLSTDFFSLTPGQPNTVQLTTAGSFNPAASLIVSFVPNWN